MRLLFILLLLLPVPGLASETLDYTDTLHFTWARIPLGALTLTMHQQDADYKMVTEAKTEGVARLFNRHKSTTTVSGIQQAENYLPATYRSDYVDNGEKRLIAIRYDKNGLPTEETIIPPREEIRPLVPEEMKRGSVDILTGFFLMRQKLRQALADKATVFSVTIYDGKRLFRVDASLAAPLVTVSFNGVKRPAIKLQLHREPLAGYKEKELKKLEYRNPLVTLYVEPQRLVPFGVSLKVYGATLEGWIKPAPDADNKEQQLQPSGKSG